ncbi:MAG TPA: efflux RND transporter periplasmic adaptor subunit [Opitutaceae bacterium]|nr:efflux RND transporter periplasmic adaptor subunit [Opitutaceae bacterium]
MLKRFVGTLLLLALIVVSLGAVKVAQIQQMSSQSHAMPATAVSTCEARLETWQPTIGSIATLAPVQGVTVSADADGPVVAILVENGATVNAGDLLLELDTTVERAQLQAAEAQLALAKLTAGRSSDLLARGTISQSDSDQATAELNQAEGAVRALQATIDRKRVRAPFAGRVGIRHVNIGQFVSRGQPLLPLQKLDSLYVNFKVPQRLLGDLSIGQKVSVAVDAFRSTAFEGAIAAIDPEVDPATRNFSVQALLQNSEERLRPGMFAQVAVQLPAGEPQIVLPATAISYAPYGNSVFIVEQIKGPDGAEFLGVRQQFVTVGGTRGDLIAVATGVKPGEQVVTSGIFKLRNGMPVQINNAVQPTSDPAPHPANT